jgi:hypothetical protein
MFPSFMVFTLHMLDHLAVHLSDFIRLLLHALVFSENDRLVLIHEVEVQRFVVLQLVVEYFVCFETFYHVKHNLTLHV